MTVSVDRDDNVFRKKGLHFHVRPPFALKLADKAT
jgi:hypothetical protein